MADKKEGLWEGDRVQSEQLLAAIQWQPLSSNSPFMTESEIHAVPSSGQHPETEIGTKTEAAETEAHQLQRQRQEQTEAAETSTEAEILA